MQKFEIWFFWKNENCYCARLRFSSEFFDKLQNSSNLLVLFFSENNRAGEVVADVGQAHPHARLAPLGGRVHLVPLEEFLQGLETVRRQREEAHGKLGIDVAVVLAVFAGGGGGFGAVVPARGTEALDLVKHGL